MSKTIVITGFGPFAGFDDNPSSAVLEPLAAAGIPNFDGEIHVQKMNVEYDTVAKTVEEIWKEKNPLLVVHIGAHPHQGCIKLEQQAFREGYCRYDVKYRVPEDNICVLEERDSRQTEIDVSSIVEKLSPKHVKEGLRLEVSHDPGRYLCGFSYYLSLTRGKALFIHVPEFDEVCTKEVVVELIRDVIAEVIKH